MSLVRRALAHPRLGRALRLLIASGTATSADTAVLFALVHAADVAPALATVIGCLAGGSVNFALARGWVFAVRGRGWLGSLLRYAVVVVGGGALVSAAVVAAVAALGAPLLMAKAAAIGVTMASWTYPMTRLVLAPAQASSPLDDRSLARNRLDAQIAR